MINHCYVCKSTQIAESCDIGEFSTIAENCSIGEKVTIGNHVHIAKNVIIGDHSIVGDMVSICENVVIEMNVLIEPGVVFIEALNPRAAKKENVLETRVGKNVTIHSKAVIEAGSNIEDDSVIEYCAVVSKNTL